MSATALEGHDQAHSALVEQLDAQVREVVRREGVDPQRDAPVVRRIAEGVVRDHDERSLTGVVAPVADAAAVVGELVARVSRLRAAAAATSTTRPSRRSGSTTRAGSSSPATAGTS